MGPLLGVQFLITSRFPETCTLFTKWLLHVADITNGMGAASLPECPDVLGLDVIVPMRDEDRDASRSETSGGKTDIFKVSAKDRGLKAGSPFDNYATPSVRTPRVDTPEGWAEDVPLPVAYKAFAKHEVRRMLHPELVNGSKENRDLVQPEAPIRTVRLPSAKTRPFCRWNEFKARDRLEGLEDLQMRNFVQATPSAPPALHCFRPEDRSRWVGGDFYNCVGSNSRPNSRPSSRSSNRARSTA